MVIWLSGAYGVGKSTVAKALKERMDNALVFDAEMVGDAVRENYPDCPYGFIYEDYPLWAEFCYKLIKDVHSTFRKDILVDMTLVRESSKENIIERLCQDGIEVRYIVLTASRQTIHDRILARGEDEDCWCMQNLDMAREAASAISGSIQIDTEGVSVEELVEKVLAMK